MENKFKSFTSLESVAALALEQVQSTGGPVLNFSIQAKIATSLLQAPEILDVAAKARAWQQVTAPPELYFSHGQYIGEDGLENLITELKDRTNSNRAIISLINQKDIVGSSDKAIPSFMLMQCAIREGTLYATLYYRALEVSTFLRINLEEIRMMLKRIFDQGPPFESVALTIFAFRAYAQERMNTLERCEFDRLDWIEIIEVISREPLKLARLLREKASHSTVVEVESLVGLSEFLSKDNLCEKVTGKKPPEKLKHMADELVKISKQLLSERKIASHRATVEELSGALNRGLENLAREWEEWCKQ